MKDETFDNLRDLMQLDMDAVECYEQAIEKTDDSSIRGNLEIFKDDHQRHIDDLTAYLIENDQDVPEQKPDFKGMLLEGFTSLRSSSGTDGALKAMKTNENMTNKKYREALEWNLDYDAKNIVRRGYEDEQSHLAYIEEQISLRIS